MLSRAALVYDQDRDRVVEQIEIEPSGNLFELATYREGENTRGVITDA